jgi:hypothetical protein
MKTEEVDRRRVRVSVCETSERKNKLERKTFDLEVEEKCRNIEKMANSLFDVGSCDPFLSAEAQYLSSVFAPSRLRRYRRMIEAKVPTDKLMNDIDENEVL